MTNTQQMVDPETELNELKVVIETVEKKLNNESRIKDNNFLNCLRVQMEEVKVRLLSLVQASKYPNSRFKKISEIVAAKAESDVVWVTWLLEKIYANRMNNSERLSKLLGFAGLIFGILSLVMAMV